MCLFDFADHCVVFLTTCFEYLIIVIDTNVRHVGRDGKHVQLVNIMKFCGFGLGGSSHACEFFIQAEVVLDGDGGVSLCLFLDVHTLLGLNSLV